MPSGGALHDARRLDAERHVGLAGAQHREALVGLARAAASARCRGARRGSARSRAGSASRPRSGTRRRACGPTRRPEIASSSASASSSRARITSACSTSARPASVMRTPRAPRSTSVVPASRSSAAICCEIGGLRVGERFGGGGERAARGDLSEHLHSADVEHEQSLSLMSRTIICAVASVVAHWTHAHHQHT